MVEKPPGALDHHFLEGRQYRADEIGEVVAQRNWWRLATLALSGVLGSPCWAWCMSGRSRRWSPTSSPGTVAAGIAAAPGPAAGRRRTRDPAAHAARVRHGPAQCLDRYRRHAGLVEGRHAAGDEGRQGATGGLCRKRKPLEQRDPVSVEILHILHTTGRTWQVRWEESTYSGSSGHLLERKRAVGSFTYQLETPRTREVLTYNPAGVFFHEWNWSYE